MTKVDDAARIRHMRDAAKRAVEIANAVTRDQLEIDSVEALALTHLLQTIGEAAQAVSPELRQRYPDVPWKQMIGTRHRIVHAYFLVDLDIVWRIVSRELPDLMETLEAMVEKELS